MLQRQWRGADAPRQASVAYRIVAMDNADGVPQITRSSPIMFNMPAAEQVADTRDRLEADGMAGLKQVIDLQKQNIEHSRLLLQSSAEGNADSLWKRRRGSSRFEPERASCWQILFVRWADAQTR